MNRWHELLADVEAQAEAQAEREREGHASERTRLEVARTLLVERFTAAVGDQIQISIGAAGPVRGIVESVGPDWVLLGDAGAGHEHLVMLAAVTSVTGLGPQARSVESSAVLDRLDAAWALRRLARDRAQVRLRVRDGQAHGGTLEAVGTDYLDLVDDSIPAARDSRARSVTVRLAALAVLTRT